MLLNFMYLVPEWFPQDAIMLTWPHNLSDWSTNLINVEAEMLQFAKIILNYQNLLIVCYDQEHKLYIKAQLENCSASNISKVTFVIARSNDSWARDHGPLTVYDENNNPTLLNFSFNGWGNKYPHHYDNEINKKLAEQSIFKKIKTIDFVLEGGSIEVNSKHELITTTSCLLSTNRNNLPKRRIEKILFQELGVKKILWLNHGHLEGDDTDSHIDTLARFTDDNTICYVKCSDPSDRHFKELSLMEQELQSFTNLENKPYRLVPLPWPNGQFDEFNNRLPLTYANFLIINNAVLVPNFGDPMDKIAENCLSELFSTRTIIGIPSKEIIKQFGSLHCLSMQLPHGALND